MNVLGVGTGELLLILLIALLVMGPERLPQLARQWAKLTKLMGRVTKSWYELNAEVNRQLELEDQKSSKPPRSSHPAPVSPPPDVAANTIAPPELASQLDANASAEQPAGPTQPVETEQPAPPEAQHG